MLASGLEFDVGGGNEIYKKTEALLGSTRDSDKYTTNILCFKTEKQRGFFFPLDQISRWTALDTLAGGCEMRIKFAKYRFIVCFIAINK